MPSTKIVGDVMTPNPVWIRADLSLADAAACMHEHGIRHLPVIDRGEVVGIVSERDLAMTASIPGVGEGQVEVTEAMSPNPYVVAPDTPLEQVVATMHARKIGTAVVMEDGELRGIFSVVDALAVLLELLRA